MTTSRTISTSAGLLLSVAIICGAQDIVQDVRALLTKNDFTGAAALIQNYRRGSGVTPDVLVAMSWMARGELGRKNLDQAEKWSQDTYQLSRRGSEEASAHPRSQRSSGSGAGRVDRGRRTVMAARGERPEPSPISSRAQEILRYVDSRAHSKGGQRAEPGRQAGSRAGWVRDSQRQAGAPVLLGALVP